MKNDKLVAIVLILFSVVTYLYIREWPTEARLYPQLILGIIFFLSLFLFIKPHDRSIKTISEMWKKAKENKNIFYVCLITVLFIFSINHLGFFVALPIFLICTQFMLGEHGFRKVIVPTVLVSGFIYVVFVLILNIQIPVAFWMM